MQVTAVYPGTFDPITLGHLDLIDRASKLYPKLYVAVANNAGKNPLFSLQERLELITNATRSYPQVAVVSFEGLLVDCAQQLAAQVIIRGLRTQADFDIESQMARLNRQLAGQLDTVFLMASPQHVHISSSMVREIARHGGDVSAFVPEITQQQLHAKFKE